MDVDAIPVRSANGDTVASLGGTISPQSSPLASVPLEVLLNINKHLTTPEYGKLRLTCKHIEDQLHIAFAKEFFSKRQFMFTEFSLQALVDISKSRFASSLKHVIFGLEQPGTQGSNPLPPNPQQWSISALALRNRLTTDWFQHASFLDTGRHVELLAEAFSALPHLDIVGMRDFNSQSRFRDAPNVSWNSYGTRTYQLETGMRMPGFISNTNRYNLGMVDNSASHFNFAYRVFRDILIGAGKASTSLKHYEVILRTGSLGDRAFIIPKYLEPTMVPVLANLRTIFLDLNSEPPNMHVEKDKTIITCPSYFLMKFLSHTVNLEHLRLNFRFYRDTTSIVSWLSCSPTDTFNSATAGSPFAEPPPVELKHLREINIGMITVEPKVILAIIHKHQTTLRAISLHKVTFVHKADVPAEQRINLWAKFFQDLTKLDLKLDGINMSFLSQAQPSREHVRQVTFEKGAEKPTKNWAGNDTQSGLRDFQALVFVKGLDKDSEVESNDGSEDHSDSLEDSDIEDDEDENDE
ncbi:hypothetical protein ONS95_013506 [Cadophora gregata]|uniref:uncharacterized protein n=1 Tax=Cadophora gregata TaxID=51156 RepID=UPI0026DB894D|nr:uncharacterized protein ONS95_013506 [Cadophora gregata]KAK0116493.1 hypothetical protein ONS95_013506 [Cadophora gregata]